MASIFVVDNYDSFTYNLVHQLEELGASVCVQRNDCFQLEELEPSDAAGRQSLTGDIEGHYAASREQFASALSAEAHLDAARHWQEMCYLSKLLSEPKLRVS